MLLVRARSQFRARKLEWLAAYVMLSWGVALGVGGDVFGLPGYATMARWAPQGAWAAFSFLLGAARMATLIFNGHWPRGYWFRVAGAIIGFNFWLGAVLAFFSTGGFTGVAVYHGLAIAELVNAYMIMRDHASSPHERRS